MNIRIIAALCVGIAILNSSWKGNGMENTETSNKSLDEIDRESYHAGPSPFDSSPAHILLKKGNTKHADTPPVINLDGEWELAEGGNDGERLSGEWPDAISADVPGSVHSALLKAGKIADPYVGRQDDDARISSFKTWWFKKRFVATPGTEPAKLVFDGVAIKCTVWLNGALLGSHEGMFGGPIFDIGNGIREQNTLIVKIEPAPYIPSEGTPNPFFTGMNVGWTSTVVFNCVYGWHYSNIPSLGIWRSVRVERVPTVSMNHPFIMTRDAQKGIIDLAVQLTGRTKSWSGKLAGTVALKQAKNKSYKFEYPVSSEQERKDIHLQFAIPDPQLWWPNGYGEQNLYQVKLSFRPDNKGLADYKEIPLGIRTIEMRPLPGGPYPDKYNWTFVINGKPLFIKGTGWCTMDPLMNFAKERYDRLLTLAKDQNIMMLRAWGGGMPETDEFYALCDQYGIMVFQEWPTAWNSHNGQPYDVLEETVRLNTMRLRNHPSLVMWGGGNESSAPFGDAIDMMGRYSIELDGTRPFHRGEPWGGSSHNYDCDWGRQPLDKGLNLKADFWGEFGMNSVPNYESVMRYLPEQEKNRWPAPDTGSFVYHTPVFNTKEDMERLKQFSGYFSEGKTMHDFIFGSQLAAATCTRHTLELARMRWPDCTGALYYKMNDNYPAASWACVDWYGTPKMTHYFNMDAFAPLHAVVLFPSFNTVGQEASYQVGLLDDADALNDAQWTVSVQAYNAEMQKIKEQEYSGIGSITSPMKLGTFELSQEQTNCSPLLIVAEVMKNNQLQDRTFYWTNFLQTKDGLLNLPRTTVTIKRLGNDIVRVENTGERPAAGVNISSPENSDIFQASDNFFWLNPGESSTIAVNMQNGLQVGAWNADTCSVREDE